MRDVGTQLDKTVLVSGNFNVLHPGHLRLLRFAQELGDRLTVCVQSDRLAGDHAHVPEQLRLDGVRSISFVTESFLLDEPIGDVIERLRPEFVVKGREHENLPNPESAALKSYGGHLVFCSDGAVFSSLDLIRTELFGEKPRIGNLPNDYLRRHGIETSNALGRIGEFGNLRVCVIGDLIVDEYIDCEPLGMSQEDPTIVVTPVDRRRFLGGAGIVAAHAAGLGAEVHYLCVSGSDEIGTYARGELERLGVNARLLVDETRPTTLKQRFRADGNTLLRVSHLHQGRITQSAQEGLLERFSAVAPDSDLIVFSDFNYGCLPQPLVEELTVIGSDTGLTMVADSQSSSQMGDVSRFRGMDLLTPTEYEARLSLRNHEDGLVVLAEKLRDESRAQNIILKLGAEGVLLHYGTANDGVETDRIPALNISPQDPSGAGDALLVVSSMALVVGATPWEAAYLGSIAAAVQVSRTGNIPLTQADLISEIT